MQKWRVKLNIIIFGTSTKAGRNFDIVLLIMILASIIVVFLESVESIKTASGHLFYILEWIFTIIFTFEYVGRVVSSSKPSRYIFSFWGLVDFLAIMPTYVGLIITGTHYLLVFRILRLLRVFRIFKLYRYLQEAELMLTALRASLYKIIVFLGTVLSISVIAGTLMYLVEGSEHGFASIPQSIYWAIVTITTVGFGDITPETVGGQFLASILMIVGYAIIAVPTGIVTVEFTEAFRKKNKKKCLRCDESINIKSANYCPKCGEKIIKTEE